MTCIESKDYKQCFEYISKLGDGNCSSVSKIRHTKTRKNYALKYTKLDNPSKLVIAFQQIEVIRAIDHPTAIQVYFYFVKSSPNQQFVVQNIQLGFVMEIGDRSIQQDIFIRKKKQVYYSDTQIRNIFVTLVEFFAHMQRKGYMHRDIKPANILIMPHSQSTDTQSQSISPLSSQPEVYKVCDFGFAIKNHEFSDKNIAGTASYASPKIHSKFKNSQVFVKGNNFKDDVFSLGITMIQICSLQSTENIPPQRLMPKINNKYGLKIAALLQLMIQFEQTKRPDFIKLEQMLPKYLEPAQIVASMPKVNRFNQSSQTNEEDFITRSQTVQQNQCFEKRKINRVTNGGFDKKNGQFDIVQCDINQTTVESESGRSPLNDQQSKYKRIIKISQNSKIESKNETTDKITKQAYTPRTDKQVQNKQKIQQFSIGNKKSIQPVTQPCSPSNDKVRTKRRSKQVMNANQHAIGANVNVNMDGNENKNISRGRGWFENMKKISKEFFTAKNKCKRQDDDSYKQQAYLDSFSYQFDDFVVSHDRNGNPNQIPHKLTDSNVQFLYGFPANSISQLQFVELSKKYGDHMQFQRTLLVACKRKIFKIQQNKQNIKTHQIILPVDLQQITFMKHTRPQNKLIICSTTPTCTTIVKIPLHQILQSNINNPYKIPKKDIQIQTFPSQCIAFNLSFPLHKFVKIYSNGNVVEDDRYDPFVLQTCGEGRDGGQDKGLGSGGRYGRVAFLEKIGNVVYTCTCNGLVRKYKLKEHYINGPNSLTTFYDARCTIISMKAQIINKKMVPQTKTIDDRHENEIRSRENEIIITLVTSTGCLIYLNSNLEVLQIKNISKNCLRVCHIDFGLSIGKRVLAVDGIGNFYNQLGQICYKSGIQNITNICVGGKDQKIIVACQSGCMYGIKMSVLIGEKQQNYDVLSQVDLLRGMVPIMKSEDTMRNMFYRYGK